ncbi:MAG: CDP-diacylglycerol--glycerol-3-phosphate 3-phosphatidyltransferase [PVC group bacterium]
MNLPNKITIGRMAACPFFVGALLLYGHTGRETYYAIALIIFTLAALSDGVDGYLARSRNQRTRLGSLLDPLADKVLLNSAIIILAGGVGDLFRLPGWFILVVIIRDLILLALSISLFPRWSRGEIQIRPNLWGKISAVLLMATVIWILLHPHHPPLAATRVAIYATALVTVFSGIAYLAATLSACRDSNTRRSLAD